MLIIPSLLFIILQFTTNSIHLDERISEKTLLHTHLTQRNALEIPPDIDKDSDIIDFPAIRRVNTASGLFCDFPFKFGDEIHFECLPENLKNMGGKADVTLFWCLAYNSKIQKSTKDYCLSDRNNSEAGNVHSNILSIGVDPSTDLRELANEEFSFEATVAGEILREIIFTFSSDLGFLDRIFINCLRFERSDTSFIQANGSIDLKMLPKTLTLSCLKKEILKPEFIQVVGIEKFEKMIAIFQRVYTLNKGKLNEIIRNKKKVLSFRFLGSRELNLNDERNSAQTATPLGKGILESIIDKDLKDLDSEENNKRLNTKQFFDLVLANSESCNSICAEYLIRVLRRTFSSEEITRLKMEVYSKLNSREDISTILSEYSNASASAPTNRSFESFSKGVFSENIHRQSHPLYSWKFWTDSVVIKKILQMLNGGHLDTTMESLSGGANTENLTNNPDEGKTRFYSDYNFLRYHVIKKRNELRTFVNQLLIQLSSHIDYFNNCFKNYYQMGNRTVSLDEKLISLKNQTLALGHKEEDFTILVKSGKNFDSDKEKLEQEVEEGLEKFTVENEEFDNKIYSRSRENKISFSINYNRENCWQEIPVYCQVFPDSAYFTGRTYSVRAHALKFDFSGDTPLSIKMNSVLYPRREGTYRFMVDVFPEEEIKVTLKVNMMVLNLKQIGKERDDQEEEEEGDDKTDCNRYSLKIPIFLKKQPHPLEFYIQRVYPLKNFNKTVTVQLLWKRESHLLENSSDSSDAPDIRFKSIPKDEICRDFERNFISCNKFCAIYMNCSGEFGLNMKFESCNQRCKLFGWDKYHFYCLKRLNFNCSKSIYFYSRCQLYGYSDTIRYLGPTKNVWFNTTDKLKGREYREASVSLRNFEQYDQLIKNFNISSVREIIVSTNNLLYYIGFDPFFLFLKSSWSKLHPLQINRGPKEMRSPVTKPGLIMNYEDDIRYPAVSLASGLKFSINEVDEKDTKEKIQSELIYMQGESNTSLDFVKENNGVIVLVRNYECHPPGLKQLSEVTYPIVTIRTGALMFLDTSFVLGRIPQSLKGFYQLRHYSYNMVVDFNADTPTYLGLAIEISSELENETTRLLNQLVLAGWRGKNGLFKEENLLFVENFDPQLIEISNVEEQYNITQCIHNIIKNTPECKEYPLKPPEKKQMILLFKEVEKEERITINLSQELLLTGLFVKEIKCNSLLYRCVEGAEPVLEVDTILEKSSRDSAEFRTLKNDLSPTLYEFEVFDVLKVPVPNVQNADSELGGTNLGSLVDINSNINDCVWAIDRGGNVYYRKNIQEGTLEGKYWGKIEGKYLSINLDANNLYAWNIFSNQITIRTGIFDKGYCDVGKEVKNLNVFTTYGLKVKLKNLFVNDLGCLWGLDTSSNLLFLENFNGEDFEATIAAKNIKTIAIGERNIWVVSNDGTISQYLEIYDFVKGKCQREKERRYIEINEKIETLSINGKDCLWAIDMDGSVYMRTNVGIGDSVGEGWSVVLDFRDNLAYQSLSLSSRDLWMVTVNGEIYVKKTVCV